MHVHIAKCYTAAILYVWLGKTLGQIVDAAGTITRLRSQWGNGAVAMPGVPAEADTEPSPAPADGNVWKDERADWQKRAPFGWQLGR